MPVSADECADPGSQQRGHARPASKDGGSRCGNDHASRGRQGPGYLEYLQRCRRTGFPGTHATGVHGGRRGITPLNAAAICRIWARHYSRRRGAIQGHPDGAAAGAKAMLRAVEAAVKGVALEEAAAQCPNYRRRLRCGAKYAPVDRLRQRHG